MELNFIPLDYSTFDYKDKNYIIIIGKTENQKKICIVDEYAPNFWVVLKNKTNEKRIKQLQQKIEKIKVSNASRESKVEKTEVHDKKFLGQDVRAIQVFLTNHKDGRAIASKIDYHEVDKRREYDLPIISKYIKEKNILPLQWHSVSGEIINDSKEFNLGDLDVDICIKAEEIKLLKEQKQFSPKVLTFDIETDEFEIGKGQILMISLYGGYENKEFKKVLTCKDCKIKQDFVECFSDEADMIEAFVNYVKEQDPDFLVGYFSDGFDLPYLRSIANKNRVKLSLASDDSQPVFARGRIPSAKIFGRPHIDIFRFIESVYSQYLQSETLSLNDISHELLGEKKEDFDFSKLKSMKEKDWKDFFSYNLQDSKLTYKLFEKIWPDLFAFAQIMKEPVFDITRNSMSAHVEDYILHNLDNFNEISEKRPIHEEIGKRRLRESYEGAFVFQPEPGLYDDLAMFDFTSFWPSIIVSYNLSKSTHLEKKQKNSIEVNVSGKNMHFSKIKGFFPQMLSEIIEKRKKYKKEYNQDKNSLTKARSNAYKLLANASYGYQGFFGARYYCPEAGAATTAISRDFIKQTIKDIEKQGHKIIYGDTDSIAFLLNNKSQNQTLEFLEKLNKKLPGIMELELEDFYKRGLFVSKRTTNQGAKKKYALINHQDQLKIRGFETVRRDWCKLSRKLQSNVIESILKTGNEKQALKLINQTIEQIKNRKVDKKELIIKTQLKKPIEEYRSISPHVIAAQKMEQQGIPVAQGFLVEYFIAETNDKKKTLVRDKVRLPDEKSDYNIEYYLNNQILPAVENIIEVFNIDIRELIDGKKQMKLGEF